MVERSHKITLLSEYLEGELSATECHPVAVHLRACAVCRQDLALLRQTTDALQGVPLETTPADFVEELNKRIEQEAEMGHQEEQGVCMHTLARERHSLQEAPLPAPVATEPPLATVARWVHCLGRFLFSPLRISMPAYAGVVVLALMTLLWRASPERATVVPAPPALPTSSPSAPSSPQAVSVANKPVQARNAAVFTPEQLSSSVASVPSPIETPSVVHTLGWRVAGSDPTVLRQQVKALVQQIARAVIVQENERLLVIALPTQDLSALHQELSKLGEASTPEADLVPTTPTTLLHVQFVRTSSIVSPPIEEALPSRSDRARG